MTTRVSAPRSASARAATCVKKNTGKMTECVPFDRRVGGVPRSHFVRVVTPRRARSAGVRCDDTTRRDERANGGKRKEFFVLSVSIHAPREFFRFRTRAAASRCRICGRSPGGLALLELDGVHGDVAPDQHDGSARGAEHSGAALGLWGRGRGGKVAGEFSVIAMSKTRACRRADFGKRTRTRAEERGGGGFGRYAPRRCRTSSRRGCTPAVGKEARVGKVSYGRATRDEGNPSKISPANGRAEPREGSGEARARTGSPSPPRLGAEVLKLRTGAVRARCVSARRAALTTALDMLPRAAKSARERDDTLLHLRVCEKNFQLVKYRD